MGTPFWVAFEPSEELGKKNIHIYLYMYISFRLSSKIQLGSWSEKRPSLTMSICSREKGPWKPSCLVCVPISYCLEEEWIQPIRREMVWMGWEVFFELLQTISLHTGFELLAMQDLSKFFKIYQSLFHKIKNISSWKRH